MAEVTITVTPPVVQVIEVLSVSSASNITYDNSPSNLAATNIQTAITELDHRIAVGTTPSTSGVYAQDGDLFYDTDDDELQVRRDGAWKEIVIEATTGDLDGGFFT